VRIWDAEAGAAPWEPVKGHIRWITSVAFSLNAKRIVSHSNDNTVPIWDAEPGAVPRKPWEGHTDDVTCVALSPDGKKIVSGSMDKTVCIWDAETGAALWVPLVGHTDWIMSVTFSPDGKRVISSSQDKTVRIWNVEVEARPSVWTHSLFQSLHLKSPSAPVHWQNHNGWVSCFPKELLFWVPMDLRAGLWSLHNTLVIGQKQTILSYDKFVCGKDWAKCYAPDHSSNGSEWEVDNDGKKAEIMEIMDSDDEEALVDAHSKLSANGGIIDLTEDI
jgi:WD40 repeat protein